MRGRGGEGEYKGWGKGARYDILKTRREKDYFLIFLFHRNFSKAID